ncbi:hypothetical protein ACFLY9_01905 [Patescibacteria group bacterium]
MQSKEHLVYNVYGNNIFYSIDMKKGKIFFILLLSILTFLSLTNKVSADQIDQAFYGTATDADHMSEATNFPMHQTFKPTLINRVTKVGLEFIYGTGFPGPTDPINTTIYLTNESYSRLASASVSVSDTGWAYFTFSTPVEVTPDVQFSIEMIEIGEYESMHIEHDELGGYPQGYAVTSGASHPDKDYHFEVWGYWAEDEPDEDGDDDGDSDGDGTTDGSTDEDENDTAQSDDPNGATTTDDSTVEEESTDEETTLDETVTDETTTEEDTDELSDETTSSYWWLWFLVGIILLVISGIGGYFVYRKVKKGRTAKPLSPKADQPLVGKKEQDKTI